MSNQNTPHKILIVAYNLANGGLERATANTSILLNELNNREIYLVLLEDTIGYEYGGSLVNLGKTGTSFWSKKIKKYQLLKKHIETHNFDYIIDFRYRLNPLSEFVFTQWIYKNSKVIYRIASSNLETYFPKKVWLTQFLYKKAYKIVGVSNYITEAVKQKYGFKNVETINNGINFKNIDKLKKEPLQLDFKYIIAVGSFRKIKQFDQLIYSYLQSDLPKKNIKLLLVGKGEEEENLRKLVSENNANEYIIFAGHQNNPFNYIKNAEFLVLCSLYEGFPNVLIEALACETPVVSFNLPSGVSEIIQDNENGILVENQNFDDLTNKMNNFEIIKSLKQNTRESVAKFSFETIANNWLSILK